MTPSEPAPRPPSFKSEASRTYVDDPVVAAVSHRGDRKLELIADERVGTELAEDVGPNKQIRDAEGPPLGIPQHPRRDQGRSVLHRIRSARAASDAPRLASRSVPA